MLFRGKQISDYTIFDIQSLIENKVPESKILDYKREIKFDEKSKTELIYDITSFYNTEGGCLIVGLEEVRDEENKNTGLPKFPDLKIQIPNYDELKLKIEEIIRQSTNPQITNLSFSELLSLNHHNVFLIGIRKTRTLPAMVTYGNQNRFYKRKASGKYTLDTYELYETFTQIGILEDRIADFIKERQKIISENQFWGTIGALHSTVIHIIPLTFFNSQIENFSSNELKSFFINELKVPGNHSYSYRYCLEGFHLFSNRRFDQPHEILPYTLIFRNGIIETFTNEVFSAYETDKPHLYTETFLNLLKEQIEKAFKLVERLSIDLPIYISIKLNSTTNMGLLDITETKVLGRRFEYDSLQLPITLLSNDTAEIKNQIKNILNILWQAVGENECSTVQFNRVFDKLTIT